MFDDLQKSALEYHRGPTAGKFEIMPTKSLATQRDLSLAYSPGVAAACEAIVNDPNEARELTLRGNLVAVVTNGTAVLGLGNIGPLAGKPVMEGKAVLFKKFAGIDAFDIEINEHDPDKLIDIIASLEPTFGGINLEDIKAPECFYIEKALRERMRVPVFHDDQHGTAIIVGAVVVNGLRVVGKPIEEVRVVASGAGAAAIACLDMLVALGVKRENIVVTDSRGVIYQGRVAQMDGNKERYAVETSARTLDEVIEGADIFLGLSAAGVLKPEMVKRMAPKPLVLALANPTPEILPEVVHSVRNDAIVATGRSDYPNQANNVLCFPFIFRGALDVGATTINEAMKLAAVHAIAELAMAEQSDVVASAYGDSVPSFGPEYLIPKPFDPRLMSTVAPAVAKAAMDSGVATQPIQDFDAYQNRLNQFIYHSGLAMKPVFARAKASPMRIVYAEGEDERVLRAVQNVVDDKLAKPILIGNPSVVKRQIERLGLRLKPGIDYQVADLDDESQYGNYQQEYELAKPEMGRKSTLLGTLLIHRGEADGMVCGTSGTYEQHLHYVSHVNGLKAGVNHFYAMNMLMLPNRTIFICDTQVNGDPTAEQIAEMTMLAAEEIRRFGLVARVALLSHSNLGSSDSASAQKMRRALDLITKAMPELEVEGEMHGDAALSAVIRGTAFPNSRLTEDANLLIMPNLDAANISFNLLKTIAGKGITVGPILLGCAKPVHIITPTATVRRIVNMTVLAVADAQPQRVA